MKTELKLLYNEKNSKEIVRLIPISSGIRLGIDKKWLIFKKMWFLFSNVIID